MAEKQEHIGWSRRTLLRALSMLPILGSAACRTSTGGVWPPPHGPAPVPLIDAHCHLFNATDLPAARFTEIVLLKRYAHAGPPRPWEVALRKALEVIERLVQAGVVTAADEAGAVLSLQQQSAKKLDAGDEVRLAKAQLDAQAALDQGINEGAAIAPAKCGQSSGISPSVKSVVSWLRSLRSSRNALAKELVAANQKSGFQPQLLCPALVDYDLWLDASLASPIRDQMRAAARLSRDPELPAIHGYMAYDPLRRALYRAGKLPSGTGWDPLATLREALVEHGFLGVKVYPPMGFRASGNAGSKDRYPPIVEDWFGTPEEVGPALDAALDDLWQLCVELDAPVLAHAANSNMAGPSFGRRADPTYWLPVVERHRELRVVLGHFGRFTSYTDQAIPFSPCPAPLDYKRTWEAAFGRYVWAHPDCRLYADISYLSDIFHTADRKRTKTGLQAYLSEHDPQGRHLVYGSDWVMLGIEREYPRQGGYPHRVAEFLADCGMSDDAIAGVMRGNALRALGLDGRTTARRRLESFVDRHGLPTSRLPS